MENKESKNIFANDKYWKKTSTIGIILMCITFIVAMVGYFLGKASLELMFIIQVGSIVLILFFLMLDIMDKLDEINNKIDKSK